MPLHSVRTSQTRMSMPRGILVLRTDTMNARAAGPSLMPATLQRISVIDSHTRGEPTRVVVAGAPDLGPGTVAERLNVFRDRHDRFRSAVVNEPRGSDVVVGALLCEPADAACSAGVIFFNNVGYL